MKNNNIPFITLLFAALALCCCNREQAIVSEAALPPRITLDSPDGIYTVKVGTELTIAPEVANAQDAAYLWMEESETVSTEPTCTVVYDTEGEHYLTFRVTGPGGSAVEMIRIDVLALQPPVISLPLPERTVQALSGVEYTFQPSVKGADQVCWTCNGVQVCDLPRYVFCSDTAGVFEVVFSAANSDGTSRVEFRIEVSHTLPVEVSFPRLSSFGNALSRSISLGRSLYLSPTVRNASSPRFEWTAEGKVLGTDSCLVYTPAGTGVSTVVLTVTDSEGGAMQGARKVSVEISVACNDASTVRRPASGSSSAMWNRVYEYTPAPGQFINETKSGFRDVATAAQACDYADERMRAERYVSLGAFGGYIIVGFDHSIADRDGYDFSIKGNQFDVSSEPGIVWVMQDSNGNGVPDDEWYELCGSQTDAARGYAVTYYRPSAASAGVVWTDNAGGSGEVEYQPIFHTQDFYYPAWVAEDAYTLCGTRLTPRVHINPANKQWVADPYEWGYADNFGSDMLSADGNPQAGPAKVYFEIGNAVNPDGTAAGLEYVDFIRVQTGVMATAGALGEISTEVLGFEDEGM